MGSTIRTEYSMQRQVFFSMAQKINIIDSIPTLKRDVHQRNVSATIIIEILPHFFS
jgi:hypothetical protein